jgi:hypothetical protein
VSASDLAASTPKKGVRRGASVGALLVGFVIIGALAAWLLAPSLLIPPHRSVDWQLRGFPGRVSDTTPTLTTIEVFVHSWPTEYRQGDDSWLEQRVIETPVSVTITLYTTDAYESLPWQGHGWYDTGGAVMVHLRAPLGGRLLLDGSGFQPQPRF